MKTVYLIGSVVQIIHARNLIYQTLVAFEPHLPYKNGRYVHTSQHHIYTIYFCKKNVIQHVFSFSIFDVYPSMD